MGGRRQTKNGKSTGRRQALTTRLAIYGAFAFLMTAGAHEVVGQDVEGLEDAVAFYHEFATSDLQHLHEATRTFEAITIKHSGEEPDEDVWLPAYWTSFAYTQLALFAGDARSRQYVELADFYYRMAWDAKPERGAALDADFYALKAMVSSFMRSAYPDDADVHRQAEEEGWAQARSADPQNPMTLMNQGLKLLPEEETRDEAYEILDRAIELYEPRMGTVMPNWGREFIDVWMGSYPRPEGGPSVR